MANRAVFLDRDRTIIEDPGYLSDPDAVKLLPGVEAAIRSMAQGGHRIVVVTNQAGIARGLLTEETLEKIHAEMCRQLAAGGAHVDAVHYCPYHVEGTVEQYAIDSELRKPKPGMLLKAAQELDIDLSASWMVGDSSGDVGAGQRAGCRTIRLRTGATRAGDEDVDEDAQADFTVRNLPEAAKVILRQPPQTTDGRSSRPSETLGAAPPESDEVRREILRYVRHLARADEEERFSFANVVGAVAQALALVALAATVAAALSDRFATSDAQLWALIALTFQVMALTFFTLARGHRPQR